jgi:hypothetical protein
MTSQNNYQLINQGKFKYYAKTQLDRAIHNAYSEFKKNRDGLNVFRDLLVYVQQNSKLINISIDPGKLWPDACSYIQGILNLSYFHRDFIRPIYTWKPKDEGSRNVFSSLVHHLLAKYETPYFMNNVWLRKRNYIALKFQNWHFRMANGYSFRKLNNLIVMTPKMEHFFLHASDHLTPEESIRYAQVLGLGGEKNLANAIIATRLGKHFEHEEFWRTVIQFFINIKDLNMDYVNPIVDFLYHIRIAKREVHTDDDILYLDPPQPNFSMKGRTFNSIIRLVEAWHTELAAITNRSNFKWTKSRINDYQYLEETHNPVNPHRIWSISELLTSSELELEGKMMRHCVSTYAYDCFQKKTTIWSMKKEVKNIVRRVLTIELDPFSRTIVQARGKCNSKLDGKSYKILMKWVGKERLTMGMHIRPLAA